jgi:hypothetical protein
MKNWISTLAIIVFLMSGCKGFFGEKTDLSFIEIPDANTEIVSFIPIQPPMSGFLDLTDVSPGFDELIYAVDAGRSEVVVFDQAGRNLGSIKVPGAQTVVQDRKLELLVTGTFDTTINGTLYRLAAIYRVSQTNGSQFGVSSARIINRLVHPFYFRTAVVSTDTMVRFKKAAILSDNSYYVVRTGNSNNPAQIGGPEDNVLKFSASDVFVTPASVQTIAGLYQDYFRKPISIVSRMQPPQSPSVSNSGDFIVGMADPNLSFRLQYIRFYTGTDGSGFEVNTDFLLTDPLKGDGFVGQPGRFLRPEGLAFAGDGSNMIFVADSQKDSVFQFMLNGTEGVPPPPGATGTRNIPVSFGGTGTGPMQFRNPRAVAWLNRTLYVADAGNGRISRFKLSTDFR